MADNEMNKKEIQRLQAMATTLNNYLSNVTLLCDQINKDKKKSISDLEQQVEHFKNLTVELNSRITDLTFYCDQVEHGKSEKEEPSQASENLDDYKVMLEQKDVIIQKLQSQIEELEQKSSSYKDDTETINLLVQENAALKQRLSDLDISRSPVDLTSPIPVDVDDVQHFSEEIIEYDNNIPDDEQETY
ncbi:hypothetical protein PIROE2DRAFT_21204 [Piromyces sp. E2]|nr:hypothetical protein PIROE2DRAFT_21204 [Piromyces sp. E2]|eukprot:OUM59616.1 hypothetical protein PIROE2DRAFT_21204 [Piromyces sp. E2]